MNQQARASNLIKLIPQSFGFTHLKPTKTVYIVLRQLVQRIPGVSGIVAGRAWVFVLRGQAKDEAPMDSKTEAQG